MSTSINLDSSLINLKNCNKAVKTTSYLTDLQISTTEQGQKVIQLRSYASIPYLGRIISYLRYWFCDTKPIIQEIEAIKKSHDQAIGELLDQLVEGKIQDEDKTIPAIQRYCEKLHKFGDRINSKCSLVTTTPSFASGLVARLDRLCPKEYLENTYAESKAGKVLGSEEFAKLQRLDAVVHKVRKVVYNASWYEGSNNLGLTVHLQKALATCEHNLASITFLEKCPHKLFELCQKVQASQTVEFGEGKIGPLANGEMQKLQDVVRKIRNENGFKMFLFDLHAPLEKLDNALADELRKQELKPIVSTLNERIANFKKSHPQFLKEKRGWYSANDIELNKRLADFKEFKKTHPDAKFKDWNQAQPAVDTAPILKTIAQLRHELEGVLADVYFAKLYPELSREWTVFLKQIAPEFADLADKDQMLILSHLSIPQLLSAGSFNLNLTGKAEKLVCGQTAAIYSQLLDIILWQVAKIEGETANAVHAKLESMKKDALALPKHTNAEDIYDYLTDQRVKLSTELAKLTPDQIKGLRLPYFDELLFGAELVKDAQQDNVEAEDLSKSLLNRKNCPIHCGLADSVALSVFNQLYGKSKSIDWNNLPGSFKPAELVEALATFRLHHAIYILTIMPFETPEQKKQVKDSIQKFYAIYKLKHTDEETKCFSHIRQTPEKDTLMRLVAEVGFIG